MSLKLSRLARTAALPVLVLLSSASLVHSEDAPKETTAPAVLPQDHAYQKTLRAFMATLKEPDFGHGVTEPFSVPSNPDDPEYRYRTWLLSTNTQPIIGSKRGLPCIAAPARLFTLTAIEGGDAIRQPPVWAPPMGWLVSWDYAGNPYRGSRAIKLRAFIHMCVDMLMLDHQLETEPEKGGNRTDWFSPRLILYSYPYPHIKDALPQEVRTAYETGLRKMAQRLIDWGIKGEECNIDAISILGLVLASNALEDTEFSKDAKSYVDALLADPNYFHPAGYFVDQGGIEVDFGGMAAFVLVWADLAGNWPSVHKAVEKWYRLAAHLSLPEPDGTELGPSHFNSRIGGEIWPGQWHWTYREYAAAMVTDDALHRTVIPTPQDLEAALSRITGKLQAQVNENPRVRENGKHRHLLNDELSSHVWKFRMWPSWNFPIQVCFPYDNYRKGTYTRLLQLQKKDSPLLKSPYLRGETFIRSFDDAFTIGRMDNFAAIIHSGKVGVDDPTSGKYHFSGPLGFGGGQLSAFWTPSTGSVILGRRRGMQWEKNLDPIEEWRIWPIHAVSGTKVDGKLFTSARIPSPRVETNTRKKNATVVVSGTMLSESLGQGKVLEGRVRYQREFKIESSGLTVNTSVSSGGQDTISELYETIPVMLHDPSKQKTAKPTQIEFDVAGKRQAATSEWLGGVTAIVLTRFEGAVRIEFASPQRLRLSDANWQDTFESRAICRNVLIDLLNGKPPVVFRNASTSYRIRSVQP